MNARVLFVSTGLHTGGAEKMLARMLSRMHGRVIEAGVVSLSNRGPVSSEIEALGVPVWHLGLRHPLQVLSAGVRLASVVRRFRPQVLQGWMYHGNLAASIARAMARDTPRLIWGIRQSLYGLEREKPMSRFVIQAGARFSGGADAIVYNSEVGRRQHEAFGFCADRGRLIDNGFDSDGFRPDDGAYRDVRRELCIAPDAQIVGLVARHHPMKGHEVFLRAAERLAARKENVHFVLVGRGVTREEPLFARWAENPVLHGRLHLLGERSDIPRLTAALDVAASSSTWGEGFPNSLGESMSCGVPCVATDVGDASRILGGTGLIVPAGDACALAEAWQQVLEKPEGERRSLGRLARERVKAFFSLDAVSGGYTALYCGNA